MRHVIHKRNRNIHPIKCALFDTMERVRASKRASELARHQTNRGGQGVRDVMVDGYGRKEIAYYTIQQH